MRFVNRDYFKDTIPNITDVTDCDINLVGFISEYELECLRLILGECMYNELLDNIEYVMNETNPILSKYKLKEDADIKWDYLINGRKYEKDIIENTTVSYNIKNCGCGCNAGNCDTYTWNGLIQEVGTNFYHNGSNYTTYVYNSLLADFILWKWYVKTETTSTGTGEAILKVKNEIPASNRGKAIKSYNQFVYKVIACPSGGRVSLYRYINHFKDTYPNWEGVCLDYKPLV